MDKQVDARLGWRSGVLGWSGTSATLQLAFGIALVAALLTLGVLNMTLRATWREVEDGVLWRLRPEGVAAAEVAAGTPADRAGIHRGDILLSINNRPIERPDQVVEFLHRGHEGIPLRYSVLRLDQRRLLDLRLATIPRGNLALYFVLASVGILTLLVAGSVRLRRPGDPATLRFFWLATAFYGNFVFSFVGRLDRLDWLFYWGDALAALLLPPLFFHFALVFPERPRAWIRTPLGGRLVPLIYAPAALLAGLRILVMSRASLEPERYVGYIQGLDRLDPVHLSIWLAAAIFVLVRAFGRLHSVTARRQMRWIIWGTSLGAVPFALGYAIPFAFGMKTSLAMELTAIPLSFVPLAFASALARYRLMDVEVIIKRVLVYAAAVAAIAAIYAVLQRAAGALFLDSNEHSSVIALLATLVVVLLARPVKDAIQNTFDRAFYRDRYDYRRALLGFARDLNADLDLARLADRLVARVMETFLVERMALLLTDDRSGDFVAIRTAGFAEPLPPLTRNSSLGGRLAGGHPVALDDAALAKGVKADEADLWREHGVYCFIPCVSKEGAIAAFALGRKGSGESLSSEDLALLIAVAAQAATALENGRLYRALRTQADEVDRMRQFNESILESLDAGLVVVDVADQVVRWNRALEEFYGVAARDAAGRRLVDLFEPHFIETLVAARRDHPEGGTLYRVSLRAPHPREGRRLLVNATFMPLQAAGAGSGAPAGTIIIIDDVTSRVQLEEQLQISEKMASIGVLAAGVAHEVNTPLTGISSFTQMLLEKADPDDPDTKLLEKIERQTFRAAKIVNGLLNLARPSGQSAVERGPVDVNGVIADVLSLLEHQLKVGRIQVRRELASPAPIVHGFEFKLQQVFLNLFLNARDAMPKGGWLAVSTRGEGDRVVVEVSDTGSGIPREHLSRIYDPFFTTKATGQGTGLGLSITYGIVREHDGSINCESTIGEGTRFSLSFPAASASSRPGRAV